MKKVLIISASPRKGGNSDLLCDEFARGATAQRDAAATEKAVAEWLKTLGKVK